MKRDSILSLISIAKKAGKIASGEFQTETAVKSQRAFLVIVSEGGVGKYREEISEYVRVL